MKRADAAFKPLTSSALALPAQARQWLAGDLSDDEYRAKLDQALKDTTRTRDLVRALPAVPGKGLYLASAELYVLHVRVHQASMGEKGSRRDQAALLARRLRELADRIFDRGHALVDPTFLQNQPDVVVHLPEEVPDWVAEGMAAGPPLDAQPPPPASTPPLREATRPTEPEATWLAAVARAGAPDHVDLGGDLAAEARSFIFAAESLRHEPDPVGGRERSAILRLGYLVQADAARAAQLNLTEIARTLAALRLNP
ncbi:MAG: hypothetical protein QOI47_223 [Actinomycetota bacterium]|nr:hypothetical protein [Actinomycetota bacterium]